MVDYTNNYSKYLSELADVFGLKGNVFFGKLNIEAGGNIEVVFTVRPTQEQLNEVLRIREKYRVETL